MGRGGGAAMNRQKLVLPVIAGLFVVAGVVSWMVRRGPVETAAVPSTPVETIGH